MARDEAALVPIVVRTMLPLLQQLQRRSKLLPASAAAAGAAAGAGDSSNGGSTRATVGAACEQALQHVFQLQLGCGMMLFDLAVVIDDSKLQPAMRNQIAQLLKDPAAAELLLQQLTIYMHTHSAVAAQT
jgi:hypothetical protein